MYTNGCQPNNEKATTNQTHDSKPNAPRFKVPRAICAKWPQWLCLGPGPEARFTRSTKCASRLGPSHIPAGPKQARCTSLRLQATQHYVVSLLPLLPVPPLALLLWWLKQTLIIRSLLDPSSDIPLTLHECLKALIGAPTMALAISLVRSSNVLN